VAALQFDKNGDLEKAKEAEDLLKQALKITPDSSLAVESLGNHLRKYAGFIDSVEMLDEAVEVLDSAYRATTQPSDELYDAHGVALTDRFQRTGRIEDIDEAIRRFSLLSKRPHELEKNHANTLL
jgi:tetratricopeptide (TPR) repeat protein